MRTALLTALVACADQSRRLWARRFLTGLSADEMQFIAEFVGASILDPVPQRDAPRPPTRAELAERIEEFQSGRIDPHAASRDEEHKMILLLEYLCCGAIRQAPAPLRSARA